MSPEEVEPPDERPVRVGIVGSRDFPESARWMVESYVRALPAGSTVISGGARGVDTWADLAACARGLDVAVYFADWKNLGRKAGALRNQKIVDASDFVVAFWDGVSRGTQITMHQARCNGKLRAVFQPNGVAAGNYIPAPQAISKGADDVG